ncbi:hypothetical protein LJC71_07200 [Desulfosarcina sp. OttesenSCG-928-A07]|nr:hypothetical protein [Desulfosarcina sp. OttesenSCG-928-G17]MDL2329512.1 hypothetical protein [Desulfosarcina sp. OttesenSCG-928-A07]
MVTDKRGFSVHPAAATLFVGIVLIVVVYSVMERTGLIGRIGHAGMILPLLAIFGILAGAYRGFWWFRARSARFKMQSPLYLRTLMENCLSRTCGALEKRLNTPEASSVTVFNALLLDKLMFIHDTDCMRFSDVRRQIEDSGLRGTSGLSLAAFLTSGSDYEKQELPEEIRQVVDMADRGWKDFLPLLDNLKAAHREMCTHAGDILDLLPPDPKKVEQLRSRYRYRPPSVERARRMMFALETLTYIRAIRHKNVNPMDQRRYDAVAASLIPGLADRLAAYKNAWQAIVDLYERPRPGK